MLCVFLQIIYLSASGVRHFLEGRTRFRNHSDFSEINDFISDFMISIVIS